MTFLPKTVSLGTTAEFFRLALLAGFVSSETVISWADEVIETQETPCYEVIELSLAGSRGQHEIVQWLGKMAQHASQELNKDGSIAIGMLLALALRAFGTRARSVLEVISGLERLHYAEELPEIEDAWVITLAEQLSLVEDQLMGSMADVRSDLRRFLHRYSVYQPLVTKPPPAGSRWVS